MIRSSVLAAILFLVPPAAPGGDAGWVDRSDENAAILLEVMARFNPETAGQLGVDGLDEQVIDLMPELQKRSTEAVERAVMMLRQRTEEERDPAVLQDLEILVRAAEEDIRGTALYASYQLPYYNVARIVFSGIRSLLDDQIPAARRSAAVVRLKRYAGLEGGRPPVATLARDRTAEKLGIDGLKGPVRAEVEKDLNDAAFFVDGIGSLFEKYGMTGHEEALRAVRTQVDVYNEFVRAEILPRATDDFRLPPDLYTFNLEQFGVTMKPEALAQTARKAYGEIQAQMQELALVVARERGLTVTDYRAVIRELKKDQLVGEEILPLYRKRAEEIEEMIRKAGIVTLPQRAMAIRLASEAESAASPAPHMRPPRLIGNTGEVGEFVLPLRVPGKDEESGGKIDDFTFVAASWTLTAHEGRPGHEMQFASMIETGVSTARMIFAFNSVNVEGWGLYSEAIIFPFLPPDGQLIALQHRLIRAARAYLDPELQMGMITKDEAFRILREDVVLSEAMATQEVDRYTFRAPGQATSYFYGFLKLMDLRRSTEDLLGDRFNQRIFHDFVLSQGLLPPDLMRDAVLRAFGPEGEM